MKKLPRSWFGRCIFLLQARIGHGLSFRQARPADLPALLRFRYQLYVAEGYIRAQDYPDGMFRDQYDPYSSSVIALCGGEIVGAARMTCYATVGLPTLEYFAVQLPAAVEIESLAEMGRFMVSPDYRGQSRLVSTGLSLRLRDCVRQHAHVSWLVGFMSDRVREAFGEFVPFQVLAEGPLQERHVQARQLLPGYWERGDIHPVIAPARRLLGD